MQTERNLLQRRLDDLIQNNQLAEVYRDRLLTRAPLVGRIIAHTAWVFLMEKVDEQYRHDGFVAARPADITRIKSGGRELDMAASVVRYRDEPMVPSDLALLELSSAISFFNKVIGHVSVYVERLDESVCFVGQEVEIDDEFLLLRQYGTMKSMDRSLLLIRYEDITRVEAGGTYERQLVSCFPEKG